MKYFLFACLFTFLQLNAHAQCWSSVSSGYIHSGGIKTDGTLWTWGWNDKGQLGDGTNIPKDAPIQIGTDMDWAMISVGSVEDLTLTTGGKHTAAIKTDGSLWMWGSNNYGQLGNGTFADENAPIQIGGMEWMAVSTGPLHTIAIKTDSTLWAWGYNNYGQLGIGNTMDVNVPTQVDTATNWLTIATADEHCLAIKADGSLWSWGKNNYYQLGFFNDNTNKVVPTRIGTDTDWHAITTGKDYSFALRNDSTLWGWGRNDYGQLGLGNNSSYHPVPEQTNTETDWIDVDGGYSHVIAARANGTLWGWGYNYDGQLGIGTNSFYELSEVQISSSVAPVSVSAGANSSHSIKADEDLWAWGRNWEGALGTGDLNDSNVPVMLACSPTLSIAKTEEMEPITVFPNPTLDVVYFTGQVEWAEVLDLTGRTLLISRPNVDRIDLGALKSGAYLLRLSLNGQTFDQRVLKR